MNNTEINKELNEIYKEVLEHACLNNKKTLVKKTLDLKRNDITHNTFFKISCCKKNPIISNLFLDYDCTFNINNELLEYSAITNCDDLRKNVLKLYDKHNYKPDLKKVLIEAFKNDSTKWIDYFFSINYNFSLLNDNDIISILNVCNRNTCIILLKNINNKNLKKYLNSINNIENKKIINNYLCSLVF